MIKKLLSLACVGLVCAGMSAQDDVKKAVKLPNEAQKQMQGFRPMPGGGPDELVFHTIKEIPITSVKNQNRSSTCWAFSGLGFVEAELLRMGKGEYDLAEMFVVSKTMMDRANNYVRLHGSSSFSPGGSFYDVIYCIKNYGIVPQEVMPGIMYGDTLPNHNELDAVASGYVNAIAKGKMKKLSPIWKSSLQNIYDNYLGKCPESFTYKGKTYTPMSFAQSLGFKPEDYVSLTSYTHHPFYTQFAIEIEDNWRNGLSYNLPLNEFMEVMDYAVRNGYTFAWGSDVSEKGFTRNGLAIITDQEVKDLQGSDMVRWTGKPEEKINLNPNEYKQKDVTITQEMRQLGFDNWETTDDHGMLIYGLAQDQNGNEYFMVKNSWGTRSKYNGIWYASKPFVAYKTMNILVHKDALPKHIAKKLGIK